MVVANPFRPTFGVSPPVVAGRYDLIEEFRIGLQDGPGAPARASLYLGPRGAGKTVLLNELEDVARAEGWHVVSDTATGGMVDRLVGEHLPRLLADLDPRQSRTRLTDASALGIGVGWEQSERHAVRLGLRSQLTLLTDVITEQGLAAGVLLSVDEVHAGATDELRELATTVQHCFREERPVAFVAAGLPAAVNERLLGDEVLTFFRRADRHHLGNLDLDDVAEALRQPIVEAGRAIAPDALDAAAEATRGYPFLVQMVGWQLWRVAGEATTIDVAMVGRAVPAAVRRMGELVHEPALADLSRGDRAFLAAMAIDDGPSRTGELARRLGVDDNWVSQYRRRLIAAEIISPVRRGEFDFELPYLREYLRAHADV